MDKVPLCITEAIHMFIAALDENEREKFLSLKENELSGLHHTIGRDLRNYWSLFETNTPLVNDFEQLKVNRPDDMSHIIFTSAHRKLNGRDICLDKQVKKILRERKAINKKNMEL